ncbi:MAG: hypothetical protein PHW13_02920 [Methylococcales bacterium]|nr:hypothetical protein [Methylococcales bacterium]
MDVSSLEWLDNGQYRKLPYFRLWMAAPKNRVLGFRRVHREQQAIDLCVFSSSSRSDSLYAALTAAKPGANQAGADHSTIAEGFDACLGCQFKG